MGNKIDSLIKMHSMNLPAPGCVFVFKEDNINEKLAEYFSKYQNKKGIYTVRTDTENSSMSCKRILSATQQEAIELSTQWQKEGFQIILQELIDEREEIKSGNIWLKDNEIIIEGAADKHIKFANGKAQVEVNISVPRFESLETTSHRLYTNQTCFSHSEILRLIRLARKIPYTDAIVEFSFFLGDRLYFWEIKTPKKYNIGIDIDKTLTNETSYNIDSLHSPQEILDKAVLGCSVKNGVEILHNKKFNIILITGRLERSRAATIQWLNQMNIPFHKLIMIPNNYYKNGFDMELYKKFKLNACLENKLDFYFDDNEEIVKLINKNGIPSGIVKGRFDTAVKKLIRGL